MANPHPSEPSPFRLALLRAACLLGWGIAALLVTLWIASSWKASHRDREGAVRLLGSWFWGFPPGMPGVEKDFQHALDAFETHLTERGFVKLCSMPASKNGSGDTLHIYLGNVGTDEVGIRACERDGNPRVGLEVEIAYEVVGYDWDVPERVAAIRAVGDEIAAWADAHERSNPVFAEMSERKRSSGTD